MRHYIRADIVDINDESSRVLEYYDALVSIDPDIEVFSDNIDVFEGKSS